MECPLCSGTGECIIQEESVDGQLVACPCPVCYGKGELTGEFHGSTKATEVLSMVNYIRLAKLSDIDTKLDALDAKLDTLDTHLDAIETKIDAL